MSFSSQFNEREAPGGADAWRSADAQPGAGGFLVTSRNNSYPSWWERYDTPFREPRKYVQYCGKATLALHMKQGQVAFTALTCGSWSCPACRKVLAAQLLDRLRRGMESRGDCQRVLLTLTIDPARFGARPIGHAHWDHQGNPTDPWTAVRHTTLWSQPTAQQFQEACEAMSNEWDKLNVRLGQKCRRLETERFGYFRVIELHRNGWPHYHVVLEHPELGADDIQRQVSGWGLGRTDAREISLDDAVGELAPYLCSSERKGAGTKAYQFAATALPENFRLHSSSRGFLAATAKPENFHEIEHSFPVKGHFTSHHESVKAWGADARIVLHPPQPADKPHKPPSATIATGDAATAYYLELLSCQEVHLEPEQVALLAKIEPKSLLDKQGPTAATLGGSGCKFLQDSG